MTAPTSRLPGFHQQSRQDRLRLVSDQAGLEPDAVAAFAAASAALGDTADHLVENAIGTLNLPLGIATNLIVDGEEILVPMATEESSVIAAVCNGARQCRDGGGVATGSDGSLTIAQVQVYGLADPVHARAAVLERRDELHALCDRVDPLLVELGGGFRDLEARLLPALPDTLVVHLVVDTRDAMGANAVNSMAEAAAPLLAEMTGGTVALRILSNLADRRLVRARATWTPDALGGPNLDGTEVRDGIVRAGRFAAADPYRATTHNKGIMNGVSAVVLATGNDTRAVESGAHAYAARSGRYDALSRWEVSAEGNLVGVLEMPLSVGIVGGATKVHPTARLAMQIMRIDGADRLARIAAAVGLVQNFSALKALATEGIQRGHMTLHAKNVAISAGARNEEIEPLARALVERGEVRVEVAEALLRELRGAGPG